MAPKITKPKGMLEKLGKQNFEQGLEPDGTGWLVCLGKKATYPESGGLGSPEVTVCYRTHINY